MLIYNIKRYLLNLLLWLDIGSNVIIFGGSPYETISSRVGKHADKGELWACRICLVLAAVLGKQHCKNSEVPSYNDNLRGDL